MKDPDMTFENMKQDMTGAFRITTPAVTQVHAAFSHIRTFDPPIKSF